MDCRLYNRPSSTADTTGTLQKGTRVEKEEDYRQSSGSGVVYWYRVKSVNGFKGRLDLL
jgi:hypothetical protein